MSLPLITFTITQRLKLQTISDLFITALEGGSNYWLYSIRAEPAGSVKDENYWAKIFADNREARIFFLTEDEVETEDDGSISTPETCVSVGPEQLASALAATVHTQNLQVLHGELDDYDANDADYFLQQLLFKEQVYG